MTDINADRAPGPTLSRRAFTASVALALSGSIAGCIEGPGGPTIEEGTGFASFFALADWGNQVGGEHFAFEQPVAVGDIGHGWDPDFDITAEAATKQVFLYLDTPEFAWAQELASTLEEDHPSVSRIDGMRAIPQEEFLGFDVTRPSRRPPDDDVEFDPETFTIGEFEVIDPRTGDVVAWWHDDHWHGGLPDIPLDGELTVSIYLEDDRGYVPSLGEGGHFDLDAEIATGAPGDLLTIDSERDEVTFSGHETGQTLVSFTVHGDGEVVFDTAGDTLVATVADEDEIDIDVFHDPHVWVDPILASYVVEDIAEGLASVDPDNATDYHENAAAYVDELEALHTDIEALVDDAALTSVVFAGHHAFGYVANRYGIDFHTPVGVSADAEVTLSDISNLAHVVDANGIDTILYDPFEAPDPDHELPAMVEVLLEETDAEYAEPLTAIEGTTPQWRDQGYGWLEHWREINLPALEAALKPNQ